MSSDNRSLQRGIQILKAFRPGSDLLGNGEIAERTGLSRSTVSRLVQTLVGTGMLEHDAKQRAYRLAPPVLSMAFAMKSGSPLLHIAAPIMRETSQNLKVNVGLAIADGDEMVYLESIRYTRRIAHRNVVAGLRVPIGLTSLGRAWLSSLDATSLRAFLKKHSFKQALQAEIEQAIHSVQTTGFCYAAWQPEVVAVATPLLFRDKQTCYALNLSVSGEPDPNAVVQNLGHELLLLKEKLLSKFAT